MSNTVMLEHSDVATRLPVQDLERARLFYAEKLGLEPVEERPGGLLYRCGSGAFALFISSGASSGTHTQMGWEVTDLRATVEALRARGVVFEQYDFPGLKTVDGIAEVAGNYPSKAGIFDHDWQKKFGMSYPEIEWPPTGERFTGKPMWDEYRAKYKDGTVIVHMMKEEMVENEELVNGVFAGKSVRAQAQNKGRAK